MNPVIPRLSGLLRRRELLVRAGGGLGLLALHGRFAGAALLAADEASAKPAGHHYPARADAVIWLMMAGGPSQIDTFDYKPELARLGGLTIDTKAQGIEGFFGTNNAVLRRPAFAFARHGQSGAWVSELFPHLATVVDEIAFVKSCHANSNNHVPALFEMNTGQTRQGFPCAGAWLSYGLGSRNRDLPAFMVMPDPGGLPSGQGQNWSAGFLPASHQGVALLSRGAPILNLSRPDGVSAAKQRAQIDAITALDREHLVRHPDEDDLQARIESFELAYRMQSEVPGIFDLSTENAATLALYGATPGTSNFASQCLVARRLVENGVRFIQVWSGQVSPGWDDSHGDNDGTHRRMAASVDQPTAGLIADLKQRGLLDRTLVVWGGEFGRLPVGQGGKGSDHGPKGFTTFFAGGGVRGGLSHGATDEIGHRAAADPVSVHDLHATILHQLGIDHKRLTFLHNGRRYRLTDVHGEVIQAILA